MRLSIVSSILGSLLALLLPGATPPWPPLAPSPPPPLSSIVIRTLVDPETLNLVTAVDASAQEIHGYIYETLTITNPVTLEREPWIADSLPRISKDHLTYDFALRRNALFSDGAPVTGRDFIFYLKAIKNPLVVNAAATREYYRKVVSAELVDNDPYRLRVRKSEPSILAADIIGDLYALPKHIWDPTGLSDRIGWEALASAETSGDPAVRELADRIQDVEKGFSPGFLVGSGPYRFTGYERNSRVTLQRNERYWRAGHPLAAANADQLVWQTIPDPVSAFAALKQEAIDFMPMIDESVWSREGAGMNDIPETITFAEYDMPVYQYIGYNQARPILADARTRRALSHAVDRQAIIDTIYNRRARRVDSPIPSFRPEHDSTLVGIGYDMGKARALLAEAGWSDSDGNGILDRKIDGARKEFRFEILVNAGNQLRSSIATMVQRSLRTLGIVVTIRQLDWALFLERTRTGEFDAFIGGWAIGASESDLGLLWHSRSIGAGGSNFIRFSNREADRIIEQIEKEFDPVRRRPLYHRFERILQEEQPYTFLVSPRYMAGYNRRIGNVRFYPVRPGYRAGEWVLR
jgi:peptide/nickel transport system substrate-binding protein